LRAGQQQECMAMTKPKSDGCRYFNKPFGVPRTIAAGRVLAHNHVQHTTYMGHGINGFRCWTWPKGKVPRNFKRCKCGWSGLPHYRLRADSKRIEALRDRCITQARLDQINRSD
jgi:hypothetical protein